jgi:DNA-binding NtrC family response regulator
MRLLILSFIHGYSSEKAFKRPRRWWSATGSIFLPQEEQFDLTLLDYRLQLGIKAVDVVKKLRERWPGMRVVVLSDMMWLPEDMAAHADGFIRKGEPQLLIEKVIEMTKHTENPIGA